MGEKCQGTQPLSKGGHALDFIVAHSPNVRMAHKATELLCVRDTQECLPGSADLSFTDVAETEPVFQAKAMPSLGLQAEVGSSYTPQGLAWGDTSVCRCTSGVVLPDCLRCCIFLAPQPGCLFKMTGF